jgi:hypothetical protein
MSLFHAVNLGLVASTALASTALASTALASPVRGPSKEWTIEPPAGWQENADLTSKARDQLNSSRIKPQEIEVRVWNPPGRDEILVIQRCVLPIDGNIEDQIDTFDRGVVKAFAKSSIAVDRSRKVVGSMVLRDVRIDRLQGTDDTRRMVRRYQPAADGLHVLVAMCRVALDPAPCDAALDGVQFTVSNPISLHESSDAAYQLGRATGALIIVLAPLLVLYYLVRRRLRARAAAVKAAGPPGWPPGPGGAVGGT